MALPSQSYHKKQAAITIDSDRPFYLDAGAEREGSPRQPDWKTSAILLLYWLLSPPLLHAIPSRNNPRGKQTRIIQKTLLR
jgi:hypothetical protein